MIVVLIIGMNIVPAAGKTNENNISSEQFKIVNSGNTVLTASENDWWPLIHYDESNTGNSPSSGPNGNSLLWKEETGNNITVNVESFTGTIPEEQIDSLIESINDRVEFGNARILTA